MQLRNLHDDINFMLMSSRSLAREYARVIFDRVNNAQSILKRSVPGIVGDPSFWIHSIFWMHPFRIAEATHPQAFHMYRCAGIGNQFAVITLRYRTI